MLSDAATTADPKKERLLPHRLGAVGSSELFPAWFVVFPLAALAAFVGLGLTALWLADKGWYALCRALQRRGWSIEADETPATNL
jgi:hypothetical protein